MKCSLGRKSSLAIWTIAVILSLSLGCIALAQETPDNPSAGQAADLSTLDPNGCLACHEEAATEHTDAVDAKTIAASPHSSMGCQDCHSSIEAAPHTPAMLETKAACADCHSDQNDAYTASVHANKDKVAGDHPTCVSCHGNGDSHAIKPVKSLSSRQKAELCSDCHRATERMERYGVDTDAVHSYEESFHGKALLKFGQDKSADCVDCHGAHQMLDTADPKSNVGRANAEKICSKPECHPGAKENFAMSGANHLRLKLKESPILRIEEMLFKFLTVGTIIFLLGGIALDLRSKVLSRNYVPQAGRATSFLITLSFGFVVAALGLAFLHVTEAATTCAVIGAGLMGLAILLFAIRKRTNKHEKDEPVYHRFSVAQRLQHAFLAIPFTLLVLTGMPMRFANVEWLHGIYTLFGGIEGARLVHRVAAVVLIGDWIWHTVYLLYRWHRAGYKLNSWTMFPNRKDLSDFIGSSRYYLGLAKEEPKYDRFQFREKFDYFAVYWGMPVMVFSGLVLWFPVWAAERLPEIGISAAYIAHSDEAVLAFLAIALWHFYNTHFSPENFPMSKVFVTGVKTRSEMLREHPLELERIEATNFEAEPPAEQPLTATSIEGPMAEEPIAEATLKPAEEPVQAPTDESDSDESPEQPATKG